jgi:hemin uptake protein HemP
MHADEFAQTRKARPGERALPRGERDAPGAIRQAAARELLGPEGILQIEHDGQVYTLRVTRNNRLILTK